MIEVHAKIEVHIHHHGHGGSDEVVKKLNEIFSQGVKIMATQAELTVQVKAVNDRLTKIGKETKTLLDKQNELLAIIEAGGSVTAELQDAMDALSAQAQVVDDMVVDPPVI